MAKLICSVDSDVLAAGKVTVITMRKSIALLLQRNLLQGVYCVECRVYVLIGVISCTCFKGASRVVSRCTYALFCHFWDDSFDMFE